MDHFNSGTQKKVKKNTEESENQREKIEVVRFVSRALLFTVASLWNGTTIKSTMKNG